MSTIRIGTRGSALALAQSGQVADAVRRATGGDVELVPISTEGDHSTASLASLGGTGVFASALREALLAGECDLVVHSLKDLPTDVFPGLRIGAIPKRADARDALAARDGLTLATLPEGARVGTGSPRRAAQLKRRRPDLEVLDIRGNVDTRLARVTPVPEAVPEVLEGLEGAASKLGGPSTGSGTGSSGTGSSGTDYLDAVVLAIAGLTRLGRLDAITDFLELGPWPTAPGQGALAIEVRDGHDRELDALLSSLDHRPSHLAVLGERAVLAQLQAGCAAPIGATSVLDGDLLFLSATVYAPDGSASVSSSHALVVEGTPAERMLQPIELGERVASELLSLGAADLAPLGGAR